MSRSRTPSAGFRTWPIASLVIAAIAIAVLLVVRFSPWSSPRGGTVPAGSTEPTGAPEAAPDTMGLFPPLRGLGAPGGMSAATRAPLRTPAPAAGSSEAAGGAGSGASEPASADSARPTTAALSFGIVVGTYLNEGRANAERTRPADHRSTPVWSRWPRTYSCTASS
jgi:hypothetical protein